MNVLGWLMIVLVTVNGGTDGVMLGSRRCLMILATSGIWQVVIDFS